MESLSVAASTQTIATSFDNVDINIGLTKVKIGYPEGWDKPKLYDNGQEVFMSQESAEHFEAIGIGTILKEAEEVKEELKTEAPDYSKLSIEEVKEELKKRGLAFVHNSKLETLVAILQKNDFEKA